MSSGHVISRVGCLEEVHGDRGDGLMGKSEFDMRGVIGFLPSHNRNDHDHRPDGRKRRTVSIHRQKYALVSHQFSEVSCLIAIPVLIVRHASASEHEAKAPGCNKISMDRSVVHLIIKASAN